MAGTDEAVDYGANVKLLSCFDMTVVHVAWRHVQYLLFNESRQSCPIPVLTYKTRKQPHCGLQGLTALQKLSIVEIYN